MTSQRRPGRPRLPEADRCVPRSYRMPERYHALAAELARARGDRSASGALMFLLRDAAAGIAILKKTAAARAVLRSPLKGGPR